MGLDAMIFVFWMLSFKPTFSFSSLTFIKRLFSSSSLSAIRVVSSAYLRLLICLIAILIPSCASSNPALCMMYSAYKLNKQSEWSCLTLWPHGIQSMEFFSLEYWSGQPFPSPGDLPNPGIKLRSLALQVDSLSAEPQRSPRILGWVAYPFFSRSSWLRNWARVFWIAGGFFTNWAIREVQRWKSLSCVQLFVTH